MDFEEGPIYPHLPTFQAFTTKKLLLIQRLLEKPLALHPKQTTFFANKKQKHFFVFPQARTPLKAPFFFPRLCPLFCGVSRPRSRWRVRSSWLTRPEPRRWVMTPTSRQAHWRAACDSWLFLGCGWCLFGWLLSKTFGLCLMSSVKQVKDACGSSPRSKWTQWDEHPCHGSKWDNSRDCRLFFLRVFWLSIFDSHLSSSSRNLAPLTRESHGLRCFGGATLGSRPGTYPRACGASGRYGETDQKPPSCRGW